MKTMIRNEGRSLGILLLLALTSAGGAEVMLIHEDGKDASWGYSHLPATFPLTWTQARAACEAVPGSMLARVDGWQAEAAVEEYLKEVDFTEAVWLANRQTLPEVLEDEQREMNHVGGAVGVLGGDITMGGDVGVTLRCAIYRVGVGIVHELCDDAAVSAALCVQRLSNKRPLLEECPASDHRQWVLVTRRTETTSASQPEQQTTVSVVGLQQCHHHHHHHLARATCRPQGGWERSECSSESTSPKHHQAAKKPRRGHHHRSGSSRNPPLSPTVTASDDLEYERGLEEKYYFSSVHDDSARRKREAEPKPTSEVHTTHEASPSGPTSKTTTTTTTTTTTHQHAPVGHRPEVNDKVLLFITDYKRSNQSKKEESHHGTEPQNNTSNPQTIPEKVESHLDDKDTKKPKTSVDETINEIETAPADEPEEPSPPHHSIKKSLRENYTGTRDANQQENVKHHVTARMEDLEKPSQEDNKESIKGGQETATNNGTPVLQVGTGPIFVHGPDDDNETHSESPHSNLPKRARTLVFPKDSTQPNPNDSIRPENSKELLSTSTEPTGAGADTSEAGGEAKSTESTTTPSKPIIFPETPNVNTPLTPVTDNKGQAAAQPTSKPTPSETKIESPLDVQSSKPESLETVTTPEVSAATTEKTDVGKGKTEGKEEVNIPSSDLPKNPEAEHTEEPLVTAKPQGSEEAEKAENSDTDMKTVSEKETNDTHAESEKADAKAPRSEMTESPVPPKTTTSQQEGSTSSSLLITKPTEKPKGHGTQLLIAQIFKSIFG